MAMFTVYRKKYSNAYSGGSRYFIEMRMILSLPNPCDLDPTHDRAFTVEAESLNAVYTAMKMAGSAPNVGDVIVADDGAAFMVDTVNFYSLGNVKVSV
jgi:hypothetical protein